MGAMPFVRGVEGHRGHGPLLEVPAADASTWRVMSTGPHRFGTPHGRDAVRPTRCPDSGARRAFAVSLCGSSAGASSAGSSASSDSSSGDDKIVVQAREDAASFVASNGRIRGAQLEAALRHLREKDEAARKASDMQLAQAILAR